RAFRVGFLLFGKVDRGERGRVQHTVEATVLGEQPRDTLLVGEIDTRGVDAVAFAQIRSEDLRPARHGAQELAPQHPGGAGDENALQANRRAHQSRRFAPPCATSVAAWCSDLNVPASVHQPSSTSYDIEPSWMNQL